MTKLLQIYNTLGKLLCYDVRTIIYDYLYLQDVATLTMDQYMGMIGLGNMDRINGDFNVHIEEKIHFHMPLHASRFKKISICCSNVKKLINLSTLVDCSVKHLDICLNYGWPPLTGDFSCFKQLKTLVIGCAVQTPFVLPKSLVSLMVHRHEWPTGTFGRIICNHTLHLQNVRYFMVNCFSKTLDFIIGNNLRALIFHPDSNFKGSLTNGFYNLEEIRLPIRWNLKEQFIPKEFFTDRLRILRFYVCNGHITQVTKSGDFVTAGISYAPGVVCTCSRLLVDTVKLTHAGIVEKNFNVYYYTLKFAKKKDKEFLGIRTQFNYTGYEVSKWNYNYLETDAFYFNNFFKSL